MSVAAAVVIIAMMAKYKAKTLLGLSVSHNVVPGVWGKGGRSHSMGHGIFPGDYY